MQRVLLQTVGTGGENNPVWEALAFGVRERRPDVVLWCCSQQTKEQTLPKVEKTLKKAGELPADSREHVCGSPFDVEHLYGEYTRLIDELQEEMPEAQIEVDYTSGTKAMSAAMVLAGVARSVHLVHYAIGPADATGRATQTDRLLSLAPTTAVTDQQLHELGRLFDQGQFEAVGHQAAGLRTAAQEPHRFQQANSLAILAEAYSLWDRFDWGQAHTILQHADRKESIQHSGWDVSRLREQAAHLKPCNRTWNSPQRLVDLLANADRRLARGQLDDGVARLYRLTEYVAQVRFAACFEVQTNNPTSNLSLEWLKQSVPNLAGELQGQQNEQGRVDLGLYRTIQALAEGGDPVGLHMKERYDPPDPEQPKKKGPLGRQLDERNESLLAHGIKPIEVSTAEQLRESVGTLLEQHLQSEGLKLGELLGPAQFLTCPW